MRPMMTSLIAALALPACNPAADPLGASSKEPPGGWDGTVAAGTQDPRKAAAGSLPPDPGRDLDDMVPGCPGMNPQQRPRGSNCFGVFPEQCGADKAAVHVGEPMTDRLAARMESIAPGGARITRPGQAVNDDFRSARLNVHLDEQDRVEEVDCY